MFMEVEHDHVQSVMTALQISSSSNICDKIVLVSESGEHFNTSFSFIGIFSPLISSTVDCDQDILPLVILPFKLTTIENLISFLSKGEVYSSDTDCVKDIIEAAKNLGIDSQDWFVDIVEKENFSNNNVEVKKECTSPTEDDLTCAKVLVNSKVDSLALAIPAGFSDLGWSDCEVDYECLAVPECTKVKLEDLPDTEDLHQQPDILVPSPTSVAGTEDLHQQPNILVSSPTSAPGAEDLHQQPDILVPIATSVPGIYNLHKQPDILVPSPTSVPCSDVNVSCKRKRGRPMKKKPGNCKLLACPDCTKKFPTPSQLRSHVKTAHSQGFVKCEMCAKKFKSKAGIQFHMICSHKESKDLNTLPNCDGGSGATEHEGKQNEEFRLKMPECHPKVNDSGSAQEVEKKFQCPQLGCAKAFRFKLSLDHHVQRCSNEFKFPCNLCERKCVSNNDLIIHLRTHTGETPFLCNICDKKYSSKKGLSQHTKSVKHLKRSVKMNVK